jgi:ferrous iron transport protein B
MGLTRSREGRGKRTAADAPLVALAGNPNVGKSTVFNALTGLDRHTGNWTGKTVDSAIGIMRHGGRRYALCDLPGCYGLEATSPEETFARETILSGRPACTVIVCDASCLERNLVLVLQILAVTRRAVVCLNLMDEAKKRGVSVDTGKLEKLLGVEVVAASAARGEGLSELKNAIERCVFSERAGGEEEPVSPSWSEAERIAKEVVSQAETGADERRLRLDRLLTGRLTGGALMLALLSLTLYLTLVGANGPSALLTRFFSAALIKIRGLASLLRLPEWLIGALVKGGLGTLFTVVSVMLPPMAIFFPLFTFMEDLGLLPRIAFNMDRRFSRCGACGKQALTMCMGFGCNAAGVVGCRIIESPRERLIAILTNSLVPCNGRFPTLTALISVFFVWGARGAGLFSAVLLTLFIMLAVAVTLAVSKLLSKTLLKGEASSFVLELPPLRRPRIGQILVRSVLDRTLFVLGRAALAAFPAGIVIWLLSNTGGDTPLITRLAGFLAPIGRLMGLDGETLTAFLLGLPANELILPLALSIYSGSGALGMEALSATLPAHGWSTLTALSAILLTLFHSPCLTTLQTVARETRSAKYTLLAFAIPAFIGVFLCIAVTFAARLVGLG